MAEPLGLVSSVVTLKECLQKLIRFANDFSNADETLKTYWETEQRGQV
jgi:hypothetical protein